jgi:hypothetical protein
MTYGAGLTKVQGSTRRTGVLLGGCVKSSLAQRTALEKRA